MTACASGIYGAKGLATAPHPLPPLRPLAALRTAPYPILTSTK